MKVNKQLTALCRRFAAAGLRVTERRRDTYRETVERSVACDHWHAKFKKAYRPTIHTVGHEYMLITGLGAYVATISIYNDILELIIE